MTIDMARRHAVHEAGHAIVAEVLGMPVVGLDLHACRYVLPVEDTPDALRARLAAKLAGLAAENVAGYAGHLGVADLRDADALAWLLTSHCDPVVSGPVRKR